MPRSDKLVMLRTFDAKMTPLFQFMNKRHAMYVERFVKQKSPPWTDDRILRDYHFTNVFRELDRVTIELHTRVDALYTLGAKDYNRFFAILLFRAFNLPETYDFLVESGVFRPKSGKFLAGHARKALKERARAGTKVFTGAYIVTNAGSSRPKIDVMCDALGDIWERRRAIWRDIAAVGTMQGATEVLSREPMHGGFTSYEVICDLRHQKGMLDDAPDVRTWANLGPGARRGINYLLSGKNKPNALPRESDYVAFMARATELAPKVLDKLIFAGAPSIECREIEHSLCEFAKYMNAVTGQRKLKRRYRAEGV